MAEENSENKVEIDISTETSENEEVSDSPFYKKKEIVEPYQTEEEVLDSLDEEDEE